MVYRRQKSRRIGTEEGGKDKVEHALPVSASLFSLLSASLRFPSSAVPARASDEPLGVARPGPGGDKRRGGRAAPHETCAARGRCSSSGRPPRCPCARRMAVVWTFRAPSLCRHVHRELLRSAVLDLTARIPTTACHQRNYIERDSRFKGRILLANSKS